MILGRLPLFSEDEATGRPMSWGRSGRTFPYRDLQELGPSFGRPRPETRSVWAWSIDQLTPSYGQVACGYSWSCGTAHRSGARQLARCKCHEKTKHCLGGRA